MKKKMVKMVSLFVVIVFIGSCVACGSAGNSNKTDSSGSTAVSTTVSTASEEQSTSSADAAKPAYLSDTSPVTLDWYVDENWYTRAKWGKDLTSQFITNKTGVTLNIIIPTGDNQAKKSVMIASGDLPDIMGMGQWLPEWKQLAKNDKLWSFQDLAQTYDPTFFEVTKNSVLNFYKSDDGKNYVYPNAEWPAEDLPKAQHLQGLAMSVRSDLYALIGKPDMSTPDGFLNALKLVKEKSPTINGQPVIPFLIGAEFTAYGNARLDDTILRMASVPYDLNGQFNKFRGRSDPEVVTWLKALRKATELGYVTKDQFTSKDAQLQAMIKSGRVFATLWAANDMMTFNGDFCQKDPNSIYIPANGFMNSKQGKQEKPALPGGGLAGWHVNMITKSCKNPDRAIKFFHYWLSDEGQSDFWFGDPSMWEMKDGKKYMKDDIYALRNTDEQAFCSKYGGQDNYFMLLQGLTGDMYTQDIPPYQQVYYDYWKDFTFTDQSEFEGDEPDPNTPADLAWAKTKEKWGELLPKMLLAKDDAGFDQVLNQYKAEDDKNFAVYGPVMQQNYEKKKSALGK